MKKNLLFVVFALFSNYIIGQTGPGGVGTTDGTSNLVLWLDASKNTTLSGSSITAWNDLSGRANNATPPTTAARPTLVTSSVNGFSSILFDGTDDELRVPDANSLDLTQWHIFIVTKANLLKDYNAIFVKGDDALENYEFLSYAAAFLHTPIYFTDGTRTAINSSNSQYSTTNFDIFEYSYSIAVGRDVWKNNLNIATDNDNKTPQVNNREIYIGNERSTTGRFLNGNIAEIIMYNAPLNSAQRIIVNNYLAAKYNRTLSANDSYVQDDAANGNFDYEVAGIGRVDASNIQSDSKGTAIVRISSPSNLDNNEYLIWGHNNLAQSAIETTDIPFGVQARFQRVWRVSEVGDVGNINIDWDLSGFSPIVASDLRLLVDTDNNGFFNNETPISGATSLGGGIYRFTGVLGTTIADNRRFTLATFNRTTTPIPIKFIDFKTKVVENSVTIDWVTANETMNSFFTIERSKNAIDWEAIKVVPSKANSISLTTYSYVDKNPYNNLSYYRLKQIDNIGQVTYSNINVVSFNTSRSTINVFPNPTSQQIFIEGHYINAAQIKMYNINGQDITNLVSKVQQSESLISINITNISSGIYFIKLNNEVRKIIVN